MNIDGAKIAPSILAPDFARLGEQVGEAESAGAHRIRVDVMDGHFVLNISIGVPIVASLRHVTRLPLETHVMISDPDAFIDESIRGGSDSFLVHWEGNCNLHRTVQNIKARGKSVGVAINPATPASALEEILPEIDQVLVVIVDPGFGHQQFLFTTLRKIRAVRQMIDRFNPRCDLEVGGGTDHETAIQALDAGANVLVAGSAIFEDPEGVTSGIQNLRASLGMVKQ